MSFSLCCCCLHRYEPSRLSLKGKSFPNLESRKKRTTSAHKQETEAKYRSCTVLRVHKGHQSAQNYVHSIQTEFLRSLGPGPRQDLCSPTSALFSLQEKRDRKKSCEERRKTLFKLEGREEPEKKRQDFTFSVWRSVGRSLQASGLLFRWQREERERERTKPGSRVPAAAANTLRSWRGSNWVHALP